jgi:hypothetical protein
MIKNLSITTITIISKISNICFNEEHLSKDVLDRLKQLININSNNILKVTSNYLQDDEFISDELKIIIEKNKILKEEQKELENNTTTNQRGRKKKDPNKFCIQKRKKKGNGNHFNSQLTFIMKSFNIPNKTYDVKLFRPGSIGIAGVVCEDDAEKIINNLLDVLKKIFQRDDLTIEYITPHMRNYKTYFEIKPDYVVNYVRLLNILKNNNSDILEITPTIDIDKSNMLHITFKYINDTGDNKKYCIGMFLSGKINVRGFCPYGIMIDHLKILENYVFNDVYGVLVKKYKNYNDILTLLNTCRDDVIEDDF